MVTHCIKGFIWQGAKLLTGRKVGSPVKNGRVGNESNVTDFDRVKKRKSNILPFDHPSELIENGR